MYNDPGSFRSPAGYILQINDGPCRAVTPAGAEEFVNVKNAGLPDTLVQQRLPGSFREVDKGSLNGNSFHQISYLLQHPVLDLASCSLRMNVFSNTESSADPSDR